MHNRICNLLKNKTFVCLTFCSSLSWLTFTYLFIKDKQFLLHMVGKRLKEQLLLDAYWQISRWILLEFGSQTIRQVLYNISAMGVWSTKTHDLFWQAWQIWVYRIIWLGLICQVYLRQDMFELILINHRIWIGLDMFGYIWIVLVCDTVRFLLMKFEKV